MTKTLATLWEQVLERVQSTRREVVRAWFPDLKPVALDRGHLRVQTRNDAQRRYLDKTCQSVFADAAQAVTGRLVSVAFESANVDPGTLAAGSESAPFPFSGEETLRHEFTFENFIEGRCNRLALAGARAVAEAPGTCYNPLFLYGEPGLGKTHLLHAIAKSIRKRLPEAQCWYVPCDEFTRRVVENFEDGGQSGLYQTCRDLDVLLMDDVERLAGRERSQDEFFALFNYLHQMQRQIVLAASWPPADLPGLAPRLSSRFASGLVALLEAPCAETRAAILRSKAALRGLQIEDGLCDLIAAQWEGNVAKLEESLIAMDALAQKRSGPITRKIVKEVLKKHEKVATHD